MPQARVSDRDGSQTRSEYHITNKHFYSLLLSGFSPKLFGKREKMRGHLALRQGIPLHPFPKEVSRTTQCNGCVARILLKICVFLRMFLHSALQRSRKISMFSAMKKRHFSGILLMARVPIACWYEDAPAGATGHTSRRKRKKGGHLERESPPNSRSHCHDGSSFRRTLISICSTKSSSHTRH